MNLSFYREDYIRVHPGSVEVLCAYEAAVDLKHNVLRLIQKRVSLCRSGAEPRPSPLTMANSEAIPLP